MDRQSPQARPYASGRLRNHRDTNVMSTPVWAFLCTTQWSTGTGDHPRARALDFPAGLPRKCKVYICEQAGKIVPKPSDCRKANRILRRPRTAGTPRGARGQEDDDNRKTRNDSNQLTGERATGNTGLCSHQGVHAVNLRCASDFVSESGRRKGV